jgi:hypothetical protein
MVGWGKDAVDTESRDAKLLVAGVVMTTGTGVDEAFVTGFCTCTSTVDGVAMIVLEIALDRVFESMTEVASGLPFHRMTLSLVKFVPETLMF